MVLQWLSEVREWKRSFSLAILRQPMPTGKQESESTQIVLGRRGCGPAATPMCMSLHALAHGDGVWLDEIVVRDMVGRQPSCCAQVLQLSAKAGPVYCAVWVVPVLLPQHWMKGDFAVWRSKVILWARACMGTSTAGGQWGRSRGRARTWCTMKEPEGRMRRTWVARDVLPEQLAPPIPTKITRQGARVRVSSACSADAA